MTHKKRMYDFRVYLIRPILMLLGLPNRHNAEFLLAGTAAVESECLRYVRQIRGPARGYFQMERPTHRDLWERVLSRPRYHKQARLIKLLLRPHINTMEERFQALASYHAYAIAMARIRYLDAAAPLPSAHDVKAMARYWVRYYNRGGAGTERKFIEHYNHCVR